MEELIQRIAASTGVPADMVDRSAQARAQALGVPVEQVLAQWAGEEVPTAQAAPPAAPAPAPAEAPPAPAPAAISKDELIAKAAEAKGMPASLVERSAGARAKKEGIAVEAVLAEWAGIELPAAGVAPAGPAPAPAEAAAPGPVAPTEAPVEVIEPAEAPAAEAEAPAPEPKKASRYPALLAALFVIIPVFAVVYIAAVPNGPACGSAGQLAIDPVTGEAVGCDGNPYGQGTVDNFTAGEMLFAESCAICHGNAGEGGVGPGMAGGAVLQTFPEGSCSSHVEWVTLGSAGWPDPTYGATSKPVAGGMPPFGGQLTDQQIAQVVLYERVAFGGEDLATAETDCGLVEAAG